MKTASGLRIGLSTALVLISIQSSVPAAAQVFRGPVSEGAAARAMLPLMSNTPLPLSLAGGLPGLPSTLIPAPSALISPSVAPALTAVPTLAAVPVSAALPSAVAVRRPVSAREAMRSFAAARPSDASA
ncbi:MAG: hypothetical protein KGL74_01375, partial [Elusimicrobia bacterium]|nr:hypothetical protein [Elusimicrobiota bacterium]